MKTYRGSPAAARHYVEADRGRADDYYLAEGTGIAERYAASPGDGVRRLEGLTGEAYESWVAGVDPVTGAPKGRLRHDDQAVRFVEVVMNGPKSWSLAAELHPDISAAYDRAQDRAATQIIAWLAQHATTRVGPRGAQVQVAVDEIEAAVVRHHTSRAGDPHRHLHLQINARVFADGGWRGLHTVGVRDSLDAVNGIGHAAVMTDPEFRGVLAAHGFTGDPATGEVTQLAGYVGAFSARAAQIWRSIEAYETQWRDENPGREPGPVLRRAWDARAWADDRPDKVVPRDGTELTRRWISDLHTLGYRASTGPTRIDAAPIGQLDRDEAVEQVLSRLATRRSGWNAADIRGEVEQLIARRNIVAEAPVRIELAEDLTARTVEECVPLLDRIGVPEHVRALTSRHALEVEADLTARLTVRATTASKPPAPSPDGVGARLDQAQREVVAALGGDAALLVVEGAAGAGKTTTLAAARTLIEHQGGHLRVVAPTLKAARVAADQIGADAWSAAWLAYQHGFRWDADGCWSRLRPGQSDPVTGRTYRGPTPDSALRSGDLVLVDEAGMLDQDTARALLTIADERQLRVALVGDRHQLPAIGRGGVLDLAVRVATAQACLTLDTVHRFRRTVTALDGRSVTVADEEYAQLSLAMRSGVDPDAVFETLLARGQIRVHASDAERVRVLVDAAAGALTADAPAGGGVLVVADTRDQVAALNAAIRDRLITAGRVDDEHATTTTAGERIGVGDRIATRSNHAHLGVANRDVWTVTGVAPSGDVTVHGANGDNGADGARTLPAGYVREHVELAYASTVHGVQGETATSAQVLIGEHTSAASAYVAMTRGRDSNDAHLVADNVEGAREQWVAVFARDRADLGPAHAAEVAAAAVSGYARLRPLEQVLGELRQAWVVEQTLLERLDAAQQRGDLLAGFVALTADRDATVAPLRQQFHDAIDTVRSTVAHAQRLEAAVSGDAERAAAMLRREWDAQRGAAAQAARTVADGTGLFGQRRSAVRDATDHLAEWSATWQPYLPGMPTRPDDIVAFAGRFDDTPRIRDAFDQHARTAAEHAQPGYHAAREAADTAVRHRDDAQRAWSDAARSFERQLARYRTMARHPDPTVALHHAERTLADTRTQADTACERVAALLAEPTLRVLPGDRITAERDTWRAERDTRRRADRDATAAQRTTRTRQHRADPEPPRRRPEHERTYSPSKPNHPPNIRR